MKTMKKYFSVTQLLPILIFSLLFIACKKEESDSEKQMKADDQKIQTYLTEHSKQATKHSSGFYYVIDSTGDGAALKQSDVVDFAYKISLLNGTTVIEASDTSHLARFKLLSSSIAPAALDAGIALMKIGDKYTFYIPSYLAFGNYSSSLFPEYSNFIVEVKVIRSQTETDINDAQLDSIKNYVASNYPESSDPDALYHPQKFASGLYYIDNIVGTGSKPFSGNNVNINFTKKYLDGTVIRTATGVIFTMGYGQTIQGMEEGITQMHQGGKAILVMPSSIAFQQSLCIIPEKARALLLQDNYNIPEVLPYSMLEYEIILQSVY
jgi:FKBP-type peptidyl-prolyl cis-trans isomerase FkpA